jgi:hypothetical protein
MRTDQEFTADLSDVLSNLPALRLALVCEILAVVLVARDVSPRLGFMGCALVLRTTAAAERFTRPPIFSTSCEPPPAL